MLDKKTIIYQQGAKCNKHRDANISPCSICIYARLIELMSSCTYATYLVISHMISPHKRLYTLDELNKPLTILHGVQILLDIRNIKMGILNKKLFKKYLKIKVEIQALRFCTTPSCLLSRVLFLTVGLYWNHMHLWTCPLQATLAN